MINFARFTAAVLALGLASACTPTTDQIDYRDFNPSYNHQNFSTYLQGRDTKVVIEGNTFGLVPQAFGDLVTAAMQGQTVGGTTNFTTHPTNTDHSFRVIMAFNVKSYGTDLCETKHFAPVKPAVGTTLQGAWCWDKSAQSYVSARTAATNPNDPRFKKMIAETTRELFPPHMDYLLQDDDYDSSDPIP